MTPLRLFRTALLVFIASIFSIDIFRRITDLAMIFENYHQKAINVAFRSAFGIFELIMIGIIIYFINRYPARRIRLLSLLFFHFVGVLVIPMVMRDASWMALSFPWPQTLLPFDKATSAVVLVSSLAVGFILIPLLTLLWGSKAYCGYICPLGGFYSESLGRLFHPRPGKLQLLRKYGPPVNFILMSAMLAIILLFPATLDPIRTVHKLMFFMLSQVLYFLVGIPLVGARSYCTHLCPLGFEIRWIARWKNLRTMKKNIRSAL